MQGTKGLTQRTCLAWVWTPAWLNIALEIRKYKTRKILVTMWLNDSKIDTQPLIIIKLKLLRWIPGLLTLSNSVFCQARLGKERKLISPRWWRAQRLLNRIVCGYSSRGCLSEISMSLCSELCHWVTRWLNFLLCCPIHLSLSLFLRIGGRHLIHWWFWKVLEVDMKGKHANQEGHTYVATKQNLTDKIQQKDAQTDK